ncbi:unnamed protein product, partial [Meganyctiphanes norvegica]
TVGLGCLYLEQVTVKMKSIMLLVILLLLSGTSLGDQPHNSYNPPITYQSPPPGYGPSPKPPSGYGPPPKAPSGYGPPPKAHQEQCYAEKCTDNIIITKTGFHSRVVTETIPSIVPVYSQSLTTTIYSTDITQVKTVCNPVPTVIYNVQFHTVSSTYTVDECIPTKRAKTITNYVPNSIPVTINQCLQSQVYHTVPSINIQTREVPFTTFYLTGSVKQWTTYEPTSTMEYHPVCTESKKCERGYGYTQSPYH